VQQYSVDLQRELPGSMSVTLSYIGARGDNLGYGGTADGTINVNQLDPKYMALGTRLSDALPNPFFGVAAAGPLSTQALPRGGCFGRFGFNDVFALGRGAVAKATRE
jgi:hypothetical protein